ncbi:MAG TPA: hypothetical protein VH519_05490 [Hyphomicrobiaceae bacterium]|jgi:hypothetical protein
MWLVVGEDERSWTWTTDPSRATTWTVLGVPSAIASAFRVHHGLAVRVVRYTQREAAIPMNHAERAEYWRRVRKIEDMAAAEVRARADTHAPRRRAS